MNIRKTSISKARLIVSLTISLALITLILLSVKDRDTALLFAGSVAIGLPLSYLRYKWQKMKYEARHRMEKRKRS